jgi:LysR family glycine cleavage system transcriptional activator
VSLGYDHMVRDTIRAGRLERLFDTVTASFVIYSVVCEAHRAEEPLIRAFRDFVHSEVADDARPTGAAAAE